MCRETPNLVDSLPAHIVHARVMRGAYCGLNAEHFPCAECNPARDQSATRRASEKQRGIKKFRVKDPSGGQSESRISECDFRSHGFRALRASNAEGAMSCRENEILCIRRVTTNCDCLTAVHTINFKHVSPRKQFFR